MSYRTTCSHCASVFRLGADQLDAAQGWVQCSVCGAAFDAQLSLLMEDGSPLPVVEPEPVESPPTQEIAPPPEATSDEATADTQRETEPEWANAEIDDDGARATPQGIVQRESPLDLPSIILIDPDASESDDPGPLPHIQAPAYPPNPYGPSYADRPPPSAPPSVSPTTRVEYANLLAGTARLPETPRLPGTPRRTKTWIWVVSSLLLLAILLAQATYFLRDTVVSQLPQSRPAFEQACAALGCTLSLPKNLTLLKIVGSDLQTEASGRLKLALTLGNRANHVQAWPVLILTLTDQRNRPLARRSFAPSEYLGDAQRIAAGIPPRSEQALNLPLNVRNLAPMGFDLRLTY
ncbi:MAG: zinc-ribbon and DUF3426 domain-containing protein [Thiobacillus sp.]